MKRILAVLLGLMVLIASCEEAETNHAPLNGTYTGTFSRTSPEAKYRSATVTLILKGSNFEGGSSIEKYPAICKGTYQISGHEIEFTNTCPWTAEFEWTYILSGKFNFTTQGDELIISRDYNGLIFDTYKLKRQ